MNFGRWLGLLGLVAALYVLWRIQQLLLLLFLAVIIAVALNRIVRRLERGGLRRNTALAIAIAASLTLALALLTLVLPAFIKQFKSLVDLLPQAFEIVRVEFYNLQNRLPGFLPPLPRLSDFILQLQQLSFQAIGNIFVIFQSSLATLGQLLLVFILSLMMLSNPRPYRRAFLTLFPSFYRRRADEILSESEIALGSWLSGMVINCLFIGIASGIFLSILGVRLVLVHALIATVFNFIPNIGPLASAIFPILIALIDDPWKVVFIILGYFAIQNVESYWLSPTVMQSKVSLLPAITLVAQIFFASSLGIWGLVLALPLTVVAKTWVEMAVFEDVLDRWQVET